MDRLLVILLNIHILLHRIGKKYSIAVGIGDYQLHIN